MCRATDALAYTLLRSAAESALARERERDDERNKNNAKGRRARDVAIRESDVLAALRLHSLEGLVPSSSLSSSSTKRGEGAEAAAAKGAGLRYFLEQQQQQQ